MHSRKRKRHIGAGEEEESPTVQKWSLSIRRGAPVHKLGANNTMNNLLFTIM